MTLTSTYQFSCACSPTVHEMAAIPAKCPKCGAQWVNEWGGKTVLIEPK